MKLLIDTDVFCKLQIAGLLTNVAGLLAARLDDCGRLPALPHMLRRGRLRKLFGEKVCDALVLVAEGMPTIPQPSDIWLDRLTPVEGIDIGEAQLFAAAAERGLFVMSGDKRALRALRDVKGFTAAFASRVIVLEAAILGACDQLGADEVRKRVTRIAAMDKMVQICFSASNQNPTETLLSYFQALGAELDPLVLWNPRTAGRQ